MHHKIHLSIKLSIFAKKKINKNIKDTIKLSLISARVDMSQFNKIKNSFPLICTQGCNLCILLNSYTRFNYFLNAHFDSRLQSNYSLSSTFYFHVTCAASH